MCVSEVTSGHANRTVKQQVHVCLSQVFTRLKYVVKGLPGPSERLWSLTANCHSRLTLNPQIMTSDPPAHE